MSRSRLLKRVLLILLAFAAFYAVMVLVLRAIGLDNAHEWIQQSGGWAPLLFITLGALSLVAAPLSGSSLFILGGALFGKETAFLLSWAASIIGCSVNFWISRRLGRTVVGRMIGHNHLDELDKFSQNLKGHADILYLALIMPVSQDIVSYAAGLTSISYSRFAIALILSSAAIVALYIYLGSSLLEALV
jgi:uncharacterized membrane protein YdjX (TVP38/TMEM64 family)